MRGSKQWGLLLMGLAPLAPAGRARAQVSIPWWSGPRLLVTYTPYRVFGKPYQPIPNGQHVTQWVAHIRNVGTRLTRVTLTTSPKYWWQISGSNSLDLLPGRSTDVMVTFSPTLPGGCLYYDAGLYIEAQTDSGASCLCLVDMGGFGGGAGIPHGAP